MPKINVVRLYSGATQGTIYWNTQSNKFECSGTNFFSVSKPEFNRFELLPGVQEPDPLANPLAKHPLTPAEQVHNQKVWDAVCPLLSVMVGQYGGAQRNPLWNCVEPAPDSQELTFTFLVLSLLTNRRSSLDHHITVRIRIKGSTSGTGVAATAKFSATGFSAALASPPNRPTIFPVNKDLASVSAWFQGSQALPNPFDLNQATGIDVLSADRFSIRVKERPDYVKARKDAIGDSVNHKESACAYPNSRQQIRARYYILMTRECVRISVPSPSNPPNPVPAGHGISRLLSPSSEAVIQLSQAKNPVITLQDDADLKMPPNGYFTLTQYQFELVAPQPSTLNSPNLPTQANDKGRWMLKVSGLSDQDVIDFWDKSLADPYFKAFKLIRAGLPVSFLPKFEVPRAPHYIWSAYFAVYDATAALIWKEPNIIVSGATTFNDDQVTLLRPVMQRTYNVANPDTGVLTLPGFRDVNNNALKFGFSYDESPSVPAQDFGSELVQGAFNLVDPKMGFQWNLKLVSPPLSPRVIARVGTLEMDIGDKPPKNPLNEPSTHNLYVEMTFRRDNAPTDATLPQNIATVGIKGDFGLVAIRPAGEDDLEFETTVPYNRASESTLRSDKQEKEIEEKFETELPLVIPLERDEAGLLLSTRTFSETAKTTEYLGKFSLNVNETTASEASQTIFLGLESRTQESEVMSRLEIPPLLIIDRQPLMIALVAAVKLPRTKAEGESIEIGVWTNTDPHWYLTGSKNGFVMFLPPQTVGEAMEKGRDPLPPALPAPNSPDDILENTAIDFRFSPPARFHLKTSYNSQNLAEAHWNLRRILERRDAQQDVQRVGTGIESLQFELLYGLLCSVTEPGLQLAEVTARMGRTPGRLPPALDSKGLDNAKWPPNRASALQRKAYNAHRLYWATLYAQYMSRLAVLEVYDSIQEAKPKPKSDAQMEENPGLVLSENVNYRLRNTAKLRYPIIGQTPPAGLPLHPPDGLAGGVAWGFESQNVYEALWRKPESTSGQLSRPFFSSLGGWGVQKAGFDRDLTIIQADTSMGRVSMYSVERLGRIGCYWNRAKHVIVYERTVVPAKQFDNGQDQNELLGRPVLRKVREYIKILERTRHYPEPSRDPNTSKTPPPYRPCGCVEACEFPDDEIPVKSHWGRDFEFIEDGIKETGWTVPLWQPDADPEIYKLPQVLIHLSVDPDTSATPHKLPCIDPHKLVFYTRTTEETKAEANSTAPKLVGEALVETWPAIRGIDFPNAYVKDEAQSVSTHSDSNPDDKLADAPEYQRGFEKFTLTLNNPGHLVNLLGGRVDKVFDPANLSPNPQPLINAVVHNVTMVRSIPHEVTSVPGIQDTLEILDSLENDVQSTYLGIINRMPLEGEFNLQAKAAIKAVIDEKGKDLHDKYVALKATAQAPLDQPLAVFIEIKNSVSTLRKDRLEKLLTGFENDFNKLVDEIAGDLINAAKMVLDEERRLLEAKLSPLNHGVQDLLNKIGGQLQTARTFFADLEHKIKDLKNLANLDTADKKALVLEQLQRWERDFRTIRVLLEALYPDADLASLEAKLLARVAAARQAIEKDVPDLSAFKAALTGIENEIASYKAKVLATEAEIARQRDAIENALSEIDQWKEDLYHEALAKIKAAGPAVTKDEIKTYIHDAVGDIRAKVTQAEAEFDNKVKVLLNEANAAGQMLEQQVKNHIKRLEATLIEGAGIYLPQIQTLLDAGNQTYTELRQKVLEEQRQLIADAAPFLSQVRTAIEPAIQQAGVVYQTAEDTIRLVRAFGEVPRVAGMDFNRDNIAYFFDPQKRNVALSPVMALVARGQDELKDLQAMGLRVPTREAFDRLIPDALQNFDLSKIFPDFAGLRLDNLFPNLKMPSIANDNVKVTHGVDREKKTAWLQAYVSVAIPQPATLFSLGPVTVRLLEAKFEADSRIEAGINEPAKKKLTASISGNWEVQIGSMKLVTFKETRLNFDENQHLHFSLSPDKIEMTGAIQFLADVIKKAGQSDSGFKVRPLEINGVPRGIQALLDLPLPDLQAGAFGMSGLRLTSGFGLLAATQGSKTDVELDVSLGIGSKLAPFTLSVSLLAGGGWFETRTVYAPLSGRIQSTLSIGISAGAMLAISLGPIKGSISLLFGISTEILIRNRGANSLTITTMLLLRGEVEVLGFISVSLVLMLEMQYSNGRLTGRGFLSIKIKICWCFSIEFSKSIEYHFTQGSSPPTMGQRMNRDRTRLVEGNEPSPRVGFMLTDYQTANAQSDYRNADYRTDMEHELMPFANGAPNEPELLLIATAAEYEAAAGSYIDMFEMLD